MSRITLGLSEEEVWNALSIAFELKHNVPPTTAMTLHGVIEDAVLVYTAEVDEETYLEALKKEHRLAEVPPAPETKVP